MKRFITSLKLFLWHFIDEDSLPTLRIFVASMIPGLGLWSLGQRKSALTAAFLFTGLLVAFGISPSLILCTILVVTWMAQMVVSVTIAELRLKVEPAASSATNVPETRNSIKFPMALPKGKALIAHVERELKARLSPYDKLTAFVPGIEDATSHGWYAGVTEDDLVLLHPPQPGGPVSVETISRDKVSWVSLITERRNLLLTIQYETENAEETIAFSLHIPSNWVKKATAIVAEFPGTTTEDWREGKTLLAEELVSGWFLIPAGLATGSLCLMMFWIQNENFRMFALAFSFYLFGWPFFPSVIHMYRYPPTLSLRLVVSFVGYLLMSIIIWFSAVSISAQTVMDIIQK